MAASAQVDYTVTPARKADLPRLETIASALGAARPGKRIRRIHALTFILDEIERRPPAEIAPILRLMKAKIAP